jgi:hypothetical protein
MSSGRRHVLSADGSITQYWVVANDAQVASSVFSLTIDFHLEIFVAYAITNN